MGSGRSSAQAQNLGVDGEVCGEIYDQHRDLWYQVVASGEFVVVAHRHTHCAVCGRWLCCRLVGWSAAPQQEVMTMTVMAVVALGGGDETETDASVGVGGRMRLRVVVCSVAPGLESPLLLLLLLHWCDHSGRF